MAADAGWSGATGVEEALGAAGGLAAADAGWSGAAGVEEEPGAAHGLVDAEASCEAAPDVVVGVEGVPAGLKTGGSVAVADEPSCAEAGATKSSGASEEAGGSHPSGIAGSANSTARVGGSA